jgi:hypothetical protein
MDGLCKALLTAITVVVVVLMARRSGRRIAGIVAALPTVTAPALLWIAHVQGDAFAAHAAVASVAACAMLAAFALAYAGLLGRGGVALALSGGAAGAALVALPAWLASDDLRWASALALAACVAALRLMPHGIAPLSERRAASPVAAIVVAAPLSALVAAFGPALGSAAAGLLASLPVISATVAAVEHATLGPAAAGRFLRGYAEGLVGKAVFGAVFALAAVPLGAFAALLLALGAMAVASVALEGWRRGRPGRRRGWPADPSRSVA